MSTWPTTVASASSSWHPSFVWISGYGDDASASAGVREPRRPILPTNTSGAALDVPHDKKSPGAV